MNKEGRYLTLGTLVFLGFIISVLLGFIIIVLLGGFNGVVTTENGWNEYKYDKNPITPNNHAWACVIKEKNNWTMYYSITGNLTYIGRKTSSNGKNWTDHGPVLESTPDAWDSKIWCPSVIKEDDEYRMLYTGSYYGIQVGLATSPDGINWTKYENNPVFNSPDEWARNDTEGFGIIYIEEENKYLLFYNTLDKPARQIGIAESKDLINWTPYHSTPIFATTVFNRFRVYNKVYNLLDIPNQREQRYNQFCAWQFKYDGKYYAFAPSYSSVRNYAKIALYECDNPYFLESDRIFKGFVVSGSESGFDSHDMDTPCPIIFDNRMYLYYAGEQGGIWRTGLIEIPNLSLALKDGSLAS
jgi:predicted GH43/DUF377 family glycosyl hydrolase